jgi:anti-sigma regulatory factor (Ser/Thr protein kinase)
VTAGFEVVLRGGVEAAGAARSAIAESDPTLPPALQGDLSLLVTELVTNAVRHGGASTDRPLQLDFRQQDGRIRVEVVDPGTDFERPAPPANGDHAGGWGLFLVDQIAERWGVCAAPAGTCVWFELPAGATA